MDVKTLLETPHRSVHWAFINRLRSQTVKSSDSTQYFNEWASLASLELAVSLPHVFTEAINQICWFTLQGRFDVGQTIRFLTTLVDTSSVGKSNIPPTLDGEVMVLTAVSQAFVDLLAADAGRLLNNGEPKSARDNIIRVPLERNPGLWNYVVPCIRNILISGKGFVPLQGFLRYAAIDPTVPGWAQSQVLNMYFNAIQDNNESSVKMLEWVVGDVVVDLVREPSSDVLKNESTTYCQIDTNGRWGPEELISACINSIQKQSLIARQELAGVADDLSLLLASMAFNGQYPAILLSQLMAAIQSTNVNVGMILWSLVAYQLNGASSCAMQSSLLNILSTMVSNSTLMSQIPRQVEILARFPLICLASDGFNNNICNRALQLLERVSGLKTVNMQKSPQLLSEPTDSKFVSSRLSVHLKILSDYLFVSGQVYGLPFPKTISIVSDDIYGAMYAIRDQPFWLSPFLIECGQDSEHQLVASKLALGFLLSQISSAPSLRLHLLSLFMYGLRQQPQLPSELRHLFILQAIPCLSTPHDAYATSRVVTIISGLWNHAKKNNNRMRCFAIRVWTNVVKHNPRIWRDLKPIVSQFVETKKARQAQSINQSLSASDMEYEWTVLVTIRDLVDFSPARYADEVLPLIYSLLNFALESLSASSTALLIDVVSCCVEAGTVGVRSVWTTIISKPAHLWLTTTKHGESWMVQKSLARFLSLVVTRGESSETYASFRQDMLMRYVLPICGFATEDSKSMEFNVTEPVARDSFLGTLAVYPVEECLDIIADKKTPNQTIHSLLAQMATHGEGALSVANGEGGLSSLLAVLMDHEIRFMRRSLLCGTSGGVVSSSDQYLDDVDSQMSLTAPDGQQQPMQSWVASNLERSQWCHDLLSPVFDAVGGNYWGSEDKGIRSSGGAVAADWSITAMVSGQIEEAASISSDVVAARLRSLLADIDLSGHWCVRNNAADSWQIWFSKTIQELHANQPIDDGLEILSGIVGRCIEVVRHMLESSHIPAHKVNSLFALVGLVKATLSVNQSLGSELAIKASGLLTEIQILPDMVTNSSPESFWTDSVSNYSKEPLTAAIECCAQLAICNSSHDRIGLSQVAQFLMAGLTLTQISSLDPLVVLAIAQSLMAIHSSLLKAAPDTNNGRSFSDELVVIEADDIRRCIERLDVLSSERTSADVGSAGLAMALASMHRHWISRFINPAMAEENTTLRATQVQRIIAHCLELAHQALKAATSQANAIVSLYYLSFVWPPRPITQRHVELNSQLFKVTPDRAWQTASKWTRNIWGTLPVESINLAETAYSVLVYHLAMTSTTAASGKGIAQSVHVGLIKDFTEWLNGDNNSNVGGLAANEKPSVRANRIICLGILLGMPLHGVPETTVSNEYLPDMQRKFLPTLLGVGSVRHGSTAWLRMSKSSLQLPLGSLLSMSGLAQYLQDTENDGEEWNTDLLEVEDTRAARVAGFVVGVLFAQNTRAIQLLLVDRQGSEDISQSTSGEDHSGGGGGMALSADIATAASEEPKSLSRLPAPTSWCRAVWESICELTDSLSGTVGQQSQAVMETRLAYLLASILRAKRPFPVVDLRKVFGRLLEVYLTQIRQDGVSGSSKQLPVLMLTLQVTCRLCPVFYSMSQFMTEAISQIITLALDIYGSGNVSWDGEANEMTLVDLVLWCLESHGLLGHMLKLGGFDAANGLVATGNGPKHNGYDGSLLTSRLLSTDSQFSSRCLESVFVSQQKIHKTSAASAEAVESDAARMFRVMSKVALSPPQVANICDSLISLLVIGKHKLPNPLLQTLQIKLLGTLERHVVNGMPEGGIAIKSARAKITLAVASVWLSEPIPPGSVRDIQLWHIMGIVGCGANADKDQDTLLLSSTTSEIGGPDKYSQLIEQQSVLLQRRIAESKKTKDAVDNWLKRTYKEWAQQTSVHGIDDKINEAIARAVGGVALVLYTRQNGSRISRNVVQQRVIQSLDMVILASSILGAHTSASRNTMVDRVFMTSMLGWLLPLLTGLSYNGGNESLLLVVADEMTVCLDSVSETNNQAQPTTTQSKQPYPVQLRTRILGLLNLVTNPLSRRALQRVALNLGVLGMIPATDLAHIL